MNERDVNKYQLYEQFAQNRERSNFRRLIPAVVNLGVVDFPVVLLVTRSPDLASQIPVEIYWAMVGGQGATGIPAIIDRLDITRVDSTNGKIAQLIAKNEGYEIETKDDKKRAINNVKATINVASKISPTPMHSFDLTLYRAWTRFRGRRHPEAYEERAISDRKLRKWRVKSVEVDEYGYPVEPKRITDALLVADRRWDTYVNNDRHPEYKRRYGALMRQEIQRTLSEFLAMPAQDQASEQTQFENISPEKINLELSRLIREFPQNDPENDFGSYRRIWQSRDESQHRRLLFQEIRSLLPNVPSTRAYKEVLIRELSFLYNSGLERLDSALSETDEPLLNAIGVFDYGYNVNDVPVFSSDRMEETEQRLYSFVCSRRRRVWKPNYYDSLSESNPVRRWLHNRREETFSSIGNILGGGPTPLERSWQWQYKKKYGKKLKPLDESEI